LFEVEYKLVLFVSVFSRQHLFYPLWWDALYDQFVLDYKECCSCCNRCVCLYIWI